MHRLQVLLSGDLLVVFCEFNHSSNAGVLRHASNAAFSAAFAAAATFKAIFNQIVYKLNEILPTQYVKILIIVYSLGKCFALFTIIIIVIIGRNEGGLEHVIIGGGGVNQSLVL